MALVDDHAAPKHGHAEAHHEPGFLGKYVFSQDHKVIGLQYGFTSLLFLLFGFTLMMLTLVEFIPQLFEALGGEEIPQGI